MYSFAFYPFLLAWSRLLVLSTSRGLSDSASVCRTCSGRVPDLLWGAPDLLWAPRTSKAHARVQAYLTAPRPGRKGQESCTLLMCSKVYASSSSYVQEAEKQTRALRPSKTIAGAVSPNVPGIPRLIPEGWTPGVAPGSATWHGPRRRKEEEKAKFSQNFGSLFPFCLFLLPKRKCQGKCRLPLRC